MSHTWPRAIFIFIVKGLWLVSSWRQADAGLISSGIHLRQHPTRKGFSGLTCQNFYVGMDCSLGCKRFGKYVRCLWHCSFWFILWKVLGRLLVFTPWCLSCIFNDFRFPLKLVLEARHQPMGQWVNGPTGQWETGQRAHETAQRVPGITETAHGTTETVQMMLGKGQWFSRQRRTTNSPGNGNESKDQRSNSTGNKRHRPGNKTRGLRETPGAYKIRVPTQSRSHGRRMIETKGRNNHT